MEARVIRVEPSPSIPWQAIVEYQEKGHTDRQSFIFDLKQHKMVGRGGLPAVGDTITQVPPLRTT